MRSLEDIRHALKKARKSPLSSAVTLIGVSKTQSPEAIEPVIKKGLRDFGENRLQEAQGKWPQLKTLYPDIKLHMIGPLQTNKARHAVALFDYVHSLDRIHLAETLKSEMERAGREIPCFIQVNTGEEKQKAGVLPREADAFIDACLRRLKLPVAGLMCVPPVNQPPAPHFALLRKIARAHQLPSLSMGMSDDFETAVRMGATHVRIGRALFGERL